MYQVVIIAGGLGSRLGKLTQKTAKALIKIDKKPFIHYQLNQLSKQGFKKVVICVGYLGDKIKKYVGNGKKFNLNIQYSHDNKKLLGTAGCIRKAIPLLEDNFFVTYGDTYLPVNFKNIQKIYIDLMVNCVTDDLLVKNKESIAGITVSPKGQFSIIKIWNTSPSVHERSNLNTKIPMFQIGDDVTYTAHKSRRK
jgi:CTP:phosphocholine cytidylyltransferase-like protein